MQDDSTSRREWIPARGMTDSKFSEPMGEKVKGVGERGVVARLGDDSDIAKR